MLRRTDAGRGVVDLVGIGLGVGDQFRNRFDRKPRIDLRHQRHLADGSDRRGVGDEIPLQLVVERDADRVRRSAQQERVAVRRRIHDILGADRAAGAGSALDQELLAEPVRQPLCDQAGGYVLRATGRKGDDDARRMGDLWQWVGISGDALGTSGTLRRTFLYAFAAVAVMVAADACRRK